MKLFVVCAKDSQLDPSVVERFRHIPVEKASGELDDGVGLIIEFTSKTTVWQLKAKLMEFTGVPPVGAQVTSMAGKQLPDNASMSDCGVKAEDKVLYSGRTDRRKTLVPVAKSKNKLFAGKKRAVAAPELSFAVGRGLRQGVLGIETRFDMYAVDKTGLLLATDHIAWDVNLELFDEAGLSFAKIEMIKEHDKANRVCHVRYTPERPGNYLLSIKMKAGDEAHISGSPFPVEVIDINNRAEITLSRKCLEEGWAVEMSQVLRRLSEEPESHRRIFEEIGMPAVLYMRQYNDERIFYNMACCLENLISIDQNKVRLVADGGIDMVRMLLELSQRVDKPMLLHFMGRVLGLLVEQPFMRGEVVLTLGLTPIQFLLSQTNDTTCLLLAARALQRISEDTVHREVLLGSTVLTSLWGLLGKGDNVFLQRLVLRVLANMADCVDRFDMEAKSFEKVVERMVSTDSEMNKAAAMILAYVTEKPEWAARCLSMLDRFSAVVTSVEVRFAWEYASVAAVLKSNHEENAVPAIGETTYELNFFFMHMLANLLSLKGEEAKQVIRDNKVLNILVHFARSQDAMVRNEACKALAYFCETKEWLDEVVRASAESGDKMAPLITLMCAQDVSTQSQICVINKMQELLDTTKGKAQAMITLIDQLGQERIISFLTHPDPQIQRNASIVLAGIVKNEAYKGFIVEKGGSTFLNNLMNLVKEGVVEVQRSVDYGEIEWLEIIGNGVSGVVWKGMWQKKLVAVKRFKEDNIAFDEEEFKSELAMMSVLRHPNIVHSLGGCTRKDTLFIIAELYSKGSMADAILNKAFKLPRTLAIRMLIDTAAGMNYLHSLNILHRDLKAGNCLISDTMTVCVTDFGVSKMMTQEMSKAAGTPMYMSPEILRGKPYSYAADTYSFAFIAWEMVARKLPYANMPAWEITKEVCDSDLRPEKLNDPLDLLIAKCWEAEPTKRPTFKSILQYLWSVQKEMELFGELSLEKACVTNAPLLEPLKPAFVASTSALLGNTTAVSSFASSVNNNNGSNSSSSNVGSAHNNNNNDANSPNGNNNSNNNLNGSGGSGIFSLLDRPRSPSVGGSAGSRVERHTKSNSGTIGRNDKSTSNGRAFLPRASTGGSGGEKLERGSVASPK